MHLVDLVPLTADPAFVIGSDRQLVAVNAPAAALVGQPVEQLIGRPCSEVIAALHPGGERVCVSEQCPVYRAMAERQPVALGWSDWARPDGRIVPISGTALASPEDDDRDEIAMVIVHVTEQPAEIAPALELRLLGETAVLVHGTPVAVPRRRRALEMIYRLAIAGPSGVRRDQLLEEFWPDVPVEDSALRLRVLLHAVRQLLDEAGIADALERRGTVCVLDSPGLRVDAREFEARARRILGPDQPRVSREVMEQALHVYRGELGASERFGDWAIPEGERLRRMYHDLLSHAVQYYAREGAVDRSVECCRLALQSDPLQEQFQIALIAYYGELGRREDAMRQYEDYRRILASEVGVAPAPSTVRALERALQVGFAG